MSLLQACRLARAPVLRSAISRGVATEATPSAPETKKEPSEILAPIHPPRDVMVADVISGAPSQLRHRAVRVYQPTQNTMQSGGAKSERWRIDFDILQGGGRWENPLMGWASSADYMQGTRLSFRSKEDAIHFAEKQGQLGLLCVCQAPTVKRILPKNYAENYAYRPGQLRIMKTK
ncbi:hypothetical protein H0H81_007937 [Sphagnurus paluster]|uniref:NADH dehydrogenase [ubiquinone] iron-sulfur protein 4, mitochondrial n=1 Tax=Sphagnurus paluster TaxID=117069 RepID=A0A9P7GRF5_9AGAR|nr:hypothetical protein H0H81_007937 [Sphagnurus paluster]